LIEPVNEAQLLNKIKKNPKEFGVLFDLYYKKIFGYALRRTANYDLAKDITAETFFKAFFKIKDFKWKGISLSSWLFRIATNEINYYYRKQKYSPASLDLLLENDDFDIVNKEGFEEERERIQDELNNHEDFISVQKKLGLLPVKYQEVISLKYFEEKSIKEISEILGRKEGTIKSLLSRGLQKLRNQF
jgi:RNA polymerase sigma-70 factor, ECF subfamily